MKKKRNHSAQFKAKIALEAMRGRYTVKEIASHFGIHPSLVHAWRQALGDSAIALFQQQSKGKTDTPTHKAMERELEELRAEQEWMRRALGGMGLREKRACIETEAPSIPILSQARLLRLHRSGLYYKKRNREEGGEDVGAAAEDGGVVNAESNPLPSSSVVTF